MLDSDKASLFRPQHVEKVHIIDQEGAVEGMVAYLEEIMKITPEIVEIHPDITAALNLARAIQADRKWKADLNQDTGIWLLDLDGSTKPTALPDSEVWTFHDNNKELPGGGTAQSNISIIKTSNLDPCPRNIIVFTTNSSQDHRTESTTMEITIPTSGNRECPDQLFRIATRTLKPVTRDGLHYEQTLRHSLVVMSPNGTTPRIMDICLGMQEPDVIATFTPPPPPPTST